MLAGAWPACRRPGPAPSLVEAVKRGDREAVRALLRAKADVNQPESDGTTALHWAVRADALELVTLLRRGPAPTSRPPTATASSR